MSMANILFGHARQLDVECQVLLSNEKAISAMKGLAG